MGRSYGAGWCGSTKPKESFAWYMKAAKQRDPDAAFAVGLGYAEGTAVPANMGEAFCWFRASLKFFDEAYPQAVDPAAPFLKNKRAAEKNVGILSGNLSATQRVRGEKLLWLTNSID